MKKLLFVLPLALLLACSQENSRDLSKSTPAIEFYQKQSAERLALLNQPLNLQRRYFSNMNDSEKAAIWKDKLQQIITYGGWNATQLNLLNQLYNQITPSIYSDSISTHNFMSSFGNQWESQAIINFGVEDFVVLFMQPHDYENGITYVYGPNTGENPDCTCNKSAGIDACDIPASNPKGSCDTKLPCDKLTVGCGWLFLQSCNANCSSLVAPSGGGPTGW